MSNIQLANNLRYLRKKHGLTQKALSKMLNISRQAYSNYETGKRTPDLDSLLFLARCYQVSLDALVLKNLPGALRHPEELSVSPVSYILAKNKKTDAAIYLSREEVEIIQMFRSISPENRRLVAGFLSNHRLS